MHLTFSCAKDDFEIISPQHSGGPLLVLVRHALPSHGAPTVRNMQLTDRNPYISDWRGETVNRGTLEDKQKAMNIKNQRTASAAKAFANVKWKQCPVNCGSELLPVPDESQADPPT
jgi:hypothetical protein